MERRWSEGGQEVVRKGGQNLTEPQLKILSLIQRNPHITRKNLSETLKINPSAIQKHIEKLKKENIITRVGGDKNGYWQLLNSHF